MWRVPVASPHVSSLPLAVGQDICIPTPLHRCLLQSSGKIVCFGERGHGRSDVPSDEEVASTSGLAAIVAGDRTTCALSAAGGVACFGANERDLLTIPDALRTDVVSVSVGEWFACAVTRAGALQCWGTLVAQLDITPANRSDLVAVTAGTEHGCGLGRWGLGPRWVGRRAPLRCKNAAAPPPTAAAQVGDYVCPPPTHTLSCTLSREGEVLCFGNRDSGLFSRLVNVPAGLSSGVLSVSAGRYHTCAVTAAGGVKCWGPVVEDGGWLLAGFEWSNVVAVDSGEYHTCARAPLPAGTPPGPARGPRLAHNSRPLPYTRARARRCVLTARGAVSCFGQCFYGQCDVPEAASAGVVEISAGGYHT